MYKEEKRPAFYRNMKYWGKKPHNIWREIISENTKKNDIVLDPFLGSGVSFFESIKIDRIPIGIDINPLTKFLIDTYANEINIEELEYYTNKIIDDIKKIDIYNKNYVIRCTNCNKYTDIYNYKHRKNIIYEVAYKCKECNKTITKEVENEFEDISLKKYDKNLLTPKKRASCVNSISTNILDKLDEDSLSSFWTNRNNILLSLIFNKINDLEKSSIKNYLMLGFLKTVHLTSKMCIPRSPKSKRPLSTSWGRPAYMLPTKQFEQNPIISFYKSIFGRQGVINAYKSLKNHIKLPIETKNSLNELKNKKIDYPNFFLGDSNKILKKIPTGSVDFIITDPPYGNIINYIDLSYIWIMWLELFNSKYSSNYNSEIILNDNNYNSYSEDLFKIWDNCYRVLKNNSKLILTFHSDNTQEWNALKKSIEKTKFKFIGNYLQKNKRSSESNVKAKKGKAISDHYILLEKGR
ncbi:DNA methyltransferase [Halanaerobium polyolivorans]|uniref:DNA methyltransferase n=1 Tax=Halanaerobium polyolivorans TaxID=2886943 RepID=UPI00210743B8|nr:DNA methyltransferase [Halanaerobium polyolivorans]